MQSKNSGLGLRGGVAVVLMSMLALPEAPAYAQRRGGGGGGRGSVRSVNRSPSGNGGSWSGARSSGTTQRSTYGNTSSRTTTANTRSGETVTSSPDLETFRLPVTVSPLRVFAVVVRDEVLP